ncbi:MAG: hypothetical protein Q8S55_13910 [Methylococcaceae bacterium]|nr:hypothetical protein [Methylococcaceae bacterium]
MTLYPWLILLSTLLFAPLSQAKALTPEQVPEPLKPWIAWVLQDNPELACPFIYNSVAQKRCSWPTRLTLDLQPTKGNFAITWKVYQDSWISLPGNHEHWPLNVSANNKTALVMDKDGVPSIKLAPGLYQISGEFFWDSLPDNLQIPDDTGLISVQVNGRVIAAPAIKDGQLWLKQSETGQSKADDSQNNLDIQVFRKISDDVPLQVLTRIELEVSGQQREIRLAKPMLDDFIPMQLQSALPARLEPDGQLLLQVRPGHWQIDLLARHVSEINTLTLNTDNQNWPDSEVWVFEAHPALRMVEVAQPAGIDASQTNLPEEWRALPAYKIDQGQAMSLNVIRRGDPEPEPNQLNLNRQLWLDFSGTGYTVNDRITGTMTRDWRLNALSQTQLGRVTLDNNNQLITRQGDKQGVEVRKGHINLDADSRIEGDVSDLTSVGWEQNFHNVRAELNLPPGWRLVAASGVDNVPDSWISRWTLLDLFMVLIAALATSRLWSVPWGVFALITLALIWHEPESPHFVWLNILAATALVKVLPENKFLKFIRGYRNLCWLALILITVPFMVAQLRIGLYPQLEQAWQDIVPQPYADSASTEIASMAPAAEPAAPMVMQDRQMLRKKAYSMAESVDSSVNFERIAPKARVQTGPGLPQWQWHKVVLSWNGAVDAGQQVHLWLLSPTLTLLLNFIRVGLVSVLALLMFGVAEKFMFKIKPVAPLALWLVLLPALSLPSHDSYADFPDQALLDTLKNKLLEAPDCLPSCAQISQMQLNISGQEMTIGLQIHAQQSVAVPLPADIEQWFPNQVLVDGENAQGLYRDDNGLWLNLSAGPHQVTLAAPAPALSKFTLPLPLKPKVVKLVSTGWDVVGLQENGVADEQLQFTRVQAAVSSNNQTDKSALASAVLPPFVRIERSLQLGLDWRVVTRVIRLSPADTAVVLAVPLLVDESVTTPGVRVKSGNVDVNMPSGQALIEWQSTLEKTDKIALTAAPNDHWIEVWQADISPIWHLETSGIAMMHLDNTGQWLPEWHPWPGEQLTLNITRPDTVEGQTLTIDSSSLSIKPGQRSQEAQLSISLRSSQGGQHSITLPEQAALQSVTINGQAQPIRQEGRKLTLPVNPGKQDITLNWQQATGIAGILNTPDVDLGVASVNSRLNISLGQDRWVLLTLGPRFGPAVLFWGVLLVIVILAVALSKIPLTPLKHWQWFLLLLGLSQIAIEAAGLVIGWLMLLGWRKQVADIESRYFNLLQVLIAGLTLLALGLLFLAVEQGLLGSPEMQITGNQSSAFNLNWYQDRSAATLPVATVISVPLIVYRLLMLAWSLWLAVSLLNWLKWGWGCFASGRLWLPKVKKMTQEATPTTEDIKQNDQGWF